MCELLLLFLGNNIVPSYFVGFAQKSSHIPSLQFYRDFKVYVSTTAAIQIPWLNNPYFPAMILSLLRTVEMEAASGLAE